MRKRKQRVIRNKIRNIVREIDKRITDVAVQRQACNEFTRKFLFLFKLSSIEKFKERKTGKMKRIESLIDRKIEKSKELFTKSGKRI